MTDKIVSLKKMKLIFINHTLKGEGEIYPHPYFILQYHLLVRAAGS